MGVARGLQSGGGGRQLSSFQSPLADGGSSFGRLGNVTVVWTAEWPQTVDVGQHGCQLWLILVFICLNYFFPQETGRGAATSHPQCSDPEGEQRGSRHICSALT